LERGQHPDEGPGWAGGDLGTTRNHYLKNAIGHPANVGVPYRERMEGFSQMGDKNRFSLDTTL
jgi:hypothetical protein